LSDDIAFIWKCEHKGMDEIKIMNNRVDILRCTDCKGTEIYIREIDVVDPDDLESSSTKFSVRWCKMSDREMVDWIAVRLHSLSKHTPKSQIKSLVKFHLDIPLNKGDNNSLEVIRDKIFKHSYILNELNELEAYKIPYIGLSHPSILLDMEEFIALTFEVADPEPYIFKRLLITKDPIIKIFLIDRLLPRYTIDKHEDAVIIVKLLMNKINSLQKLNIDDEINDIYFQLAEMVEQDKELEKSIGNDLTYEIYINILDIYASQNRSVEMGLLLHRPIEEFLKSTSYSFCWFHGHFITL